MSTRPVGAGEFRNIQAEIEALSTQVNRGQKTEEVGKKLEAFQKRLDDVLFNGTGVEIDAMAQCQLELDRVKSAFQRGIDTSSSTTAGGSPAGSEKIFSIIPLRPQTSASESTSLRALSQTIPIATIKIHTKSQTTTALMNAMIVADQSTGARFETGDDLTFFEVKSQPVLKENHRLLEQFAADDPIVYYWVCFTYYTNIAFRKVWETGSLPLPEGRVKQFKALFNEEKQKAGAFDFHQKFRSKYEIALESYQRGLLDSRTLLANGAFSKLLALYITKYQKELESELEQSYPKPVDTTSPEQVIKANQAFLSLLWMKNPLAYYWTWFDLFIEVDDFKQAYAGEIFIAATRSGTKFLTETDKETFKKHFETIFESLSKGEFDFRSKFKPYADGVSGSSKCGLSSDPAFWELLKIYDLSRYNAIFFRF